MNTVLYMQKKSLMETEVYTNNRVVDEWSSREAVD